MKPNETFIAFDSATDRKVNALSTQTATTPMSNPNTPGDAHLASTLAGPLWNGWKELHIEIYKHSFWPRESPSFGICDVCCPVTKYSFQRTLSRPITCFRLGVFPIPQADFVARTYASILLFLTMHNKRSPVDYLPTKPKLIHASTRSRSSSASPLPDAAHTVASIRGERK